MESWHKITINESDADLKESMSAMLMYNGAESVVDQEDFIEVYLDSDNLDSLIEYISNQKIFSAHKLKVEKVINENWNAIWEANFKPIDVGSIHIRATFHPKSEKQEIIIQPKMAFGTGHHETTFMMIEKMSQMIFQDKYVLDYGCGTGVLAVYSGMLNASRIDAIDIQSEAIENTIEHFKLNNVSLENLTLKEGDLDVLSARTYDIILANINRHVLLENFSSIKNKLNANGTLLMSGILKSDRNLIIETYLQNDFKLNSEKQKGEWCLFEFSGG